MVQARTFGRLIYDEDEHGWAFEVGHILGLWIRNFDGHLPSVPHTSQDLDPALMCKTGMLQRLRAHQIDIEIPHYDDVPIGAVDALEETIFESIRVTYSPAHCAFAIIGVAGSFFMWLYCLIDPADIAYCKSRSNTAIAQLEKKCHALFPDGVPQEAIFERLRRTKGSTSAIRKVLLNIRKPMVILLVLADPLDGGRLRLLGEQQRLSDSLSQSLHRDSFEIQALAEARIDNFGPTLARTKPTIIHFSGHGSQDGIYFNSPTGQAKKIEPSGLSKLLSLASQENLQGIVLNACFTSEMFRASALDQDAVLMEGELDDAAAISFSQQFYAYLGDGRSFKDAFKWAQTSAALTDDEGLRVSFTESGTK